MKPVLSVISLLLTSGFFAGCEDSGSSLKQTAYHRDTEITERTGFEKTAFLRVLGVSVVMVCLWLRRLTSVGHQLPESSLEATPRGSQVIASRGDAETRRRGCTLFNLRISAPPREPPRWRLQPGAGISPSHQFLSS